MKNFKISILVFGVLILISNCLFAAEEFVGMKQKYSIKNVGSSFVIFYTPFYMETYMPLTTSNIEHDAKCTGVLNLKDPVSIELKDIFDKSIKSTFRDGSVRLKISGLFSDPIIVDRDGIYILGQKSYALSKEKFQKLETLMEVVCKKQLQKNHKKITLLYPK